jgi:hypothetical protein
MPTSHAAVRHGVSWGKARRAEKAFAPEGSDARGISVSTRFSTARAQQFWTALSDVVHGEVIGLQKDRSETSATTLLTEELTPRERAAVTAVCADMHRHTTIKAVLRRARGMRDEEMLFLKLKWATAHPIRSARDLIRFLTAQPLYSNR